jgi:hypothetical protein
MEDRLFTHRIDLIAGERQMIYYEGWLCKWIKIYSDEDNTNLIAVGDHNVNATQGSLQGEALEPHTMIRLENVRLSKVFVDARNDSAVHMIAMLDFSDPITKQGYETTISGL